MKIFKYGNVHKDILKLALPAIAGSITQMIVSLVDAAMVGRLENAEYYLAAMGLGVLATWAIVSFFSSLATGTHVVIARRFGANDFRGCGNALNTSLVISILIGIVVSFLGVVFAFQIADFFAVDNLVGQYAGEYLYFRFMGIPFFLLSVSYRGFFFGIGKTHIFMYSGIIANFLNIIFNYIFIYGMFGIPGMGLAGAGIGSTFATFFDFVFYFVISLLPIYRNKYQLFTQFRFIKEFAINIVKISLPVSLQNIFILVGFLSFIAITGHIGTVEQAASNIVFSSLLISLMPCFGFGIAVQTLVGNSLGKGDIEHAKMLGLETSKLATIYTFIAGLIFTIFPQYVLLLLTNDWNVINTAVPAMRIAGAGQVFYSVGVVLANGLQAAGRTFYVMVAESILNWFVFVPLAYLLGVVLDFGIIGAWSALPFYVILYSAVIFIKYYYGDWTTFKKV